MQLTLTRIRTEGDATLGVLELGTPVFKKFAILEPNPPVVPEGDFIVSLEFSPKFNRYLWEFKDVPGHTELKFHNGNTAADTLGCPLIGEKHGHLQEEPAVLSSRFALSQFMNAMPQASGSEVRIHVTSAED